MKAILEILAASWSVFHESAIYMLFGFFVAGLLYVFIRPERIGRYLGGGTIRPVFLSALAGIPIPLCSCGVVPAAAALKQQGANNGATLSFLISTPESGVDSIPVTYALMDPIITVIRPVAAFITAVIAGIIENIMGQPKKQPVIASRHSFSALDNCDCNANKKNSCTPVNLPFYAKIVSGLKYAFVELLGDIGKWFVLGVLLAGLISYFLPDTLFESYLSNNLIAMLVMLMAGLPMYVCATSSTPIAAALVLKGLNPGAALVFLLVGPATNIATLSMVSGLLGKRALFVYLGSIIVCSITLGLFTDMLYYSIGLTAGARAGQAAEIFPYYIELGGAVILAVLIVFAFWKVNSQRSVCS